MNGTKFSSPAPPSLLRPQRQVVRIDSVTQDRLDDLMSRNTEGKLKPGERRELESLVETVERLSLENARMLTRPSRRTVTPALQRKQLV